MQDHSFSAALLTSEMLFPVQVEAARQAAVSSVTSQRSAELDSAAAAPECRDGSDERRPGTRVTAAGRPAGPRLPATATTYDRGEQMGAGRLRLAGARRQPLSPQVLPEAASGWPTVRQ